MADKVVPLGEAAALVADGSSVGIGGILLRRKPMALVAALAEAGRSDLDLVAFLGSVDVEYLVAAGCVRSATTGYVGFEQLGFAPAWQASVSGGSVTARFVSETHIVGGLRAAGAGLPFWPSRGAAGSEVTSDLGIETVDCPYTGEVLWAVPAIRPDVTLLHARAATTDGLVVGAADDFLHDADAVLARASGTVVVSVEEIVDRTDARRRSHGRPLLFSHDVDAVVLAPGGARPTEVPGCYGADLAGISAYLADPVVGAAGLAALVAGVDA